MKNKQLQEQIDAVDPPSENLSQEQQKINLINSNTKYFKELLYLSIKIGCFRIFAFFIIIFFDDFFIVTQGPNNFTQSWNIMFYVLASMLDFLGVLNDVQMIKHLIKDQQILINIKNDLLFNNPVVTDTQIGSYTFYLSIYDIIKKYKYKSQSSISISQTIRFLHVIITIYIFGNLAINGQNKIEGQYFKVIFLWIFILSIYINVFQMDFYVMETSEGYFIQRKHVMPKNNEEEQLQAQSIHQKQIKNQYFKRCRRPFQICYIINILLMLTVIILFFKYSLLNLMLILCICAHMIQLVNEKQIQNSLVDLKLHKLPYQYLSGYKIIWYLTKNKRNFYLFSIVLTRLTIVLAIFAYFRDQNTPAIESLILIVINILIFYSQYLKINRLDSAKLYVLTPSKQIKGEGFQCAICLVQLEQKQNLLQLPCFSQHIFHYSCIKNWLASRKQCPLCRYKLQKYQLS